ncbi:hypothetical protein F4814DRAFT_426732 [Daldinia grandis]|nr:hypothetical protein F4814DRAFT_426732 [Daldinia grandis]
MTTSFFCLFNSRLLFLFRLFLTKCKSFLSWLIPNKKGLPSIRSYYCTSSVISKSELNLTSWRLLFDVFPPVLNAMYAKAPTVLLAALLAGHAVAKTGIGGCVSSATVKYGGGSLIWYVPDTGEICEFLDCGGGRAPPKTTVPGCNGYEGTATYSPSFLPGFGASATPTSTEISAPASTSASTPTPTSASASASSSDSASGESSSESSGESSGSATTSAASSASVPGTTTGVTSDATITPAPTATLETSTRITSNGESSAPTGSSTGGSFQGAEPASTSTSSASNVSEGAAMPTAALNGAMGVAVGLVAGMAML